MGILAVAILLTLATVSCASMPRGPVVALPNGYYLRPDTSKQTVLVKRDGKAVLPGHVAAYAVSDFLVAGALGQTTEAALEYTNDLPFSGTADTRYFILDTQSGQVESDLDKTAWKARLKALGVPSDFEIFPPLPWTQ